MATEHGDLMAEHDYLDRQLVAAFGRFGKVLFKVSR